MRTLRYEGYDYELQDEEVRPGVSIALRPGTKPDDPEALLEWRKTAPLAEIKCATSELCQSEEGWYYLPRRIGPPLGGDFLLDAAGNIEKVLIAPHPLRDAIRLHPLWIAGRDDLALKKVEAIMSN